jgi:hypothetical protein
MIAMQHPPEGPVPDLKRFLDFSGLGLAAEDGVPEKDRPKSINDHFSVKKPFGKVFSYLDPFAAQDRMRIARADMGLDEMPVRHAVTVDKNKIIAG